MNALLLNLLANMPPVAKRQALVALFRATAEAFQADLPGLSGLTWEQCLGEYARFTADQAGKALAAGGDLVELQERLYRSAYRLGRAAGRLLNARSTGDVMELGRILYQVLDIDFNGDEQGDIRINHCYFSSVYTPEVCQLMSAMDRGLLAGLAGGGELAFSERITEGQPCCRGRFSLSTLSD